MACRLSSHAWNQAVSTLSVSTNRFHDSPVVETDNDWLRTCRTDVCSPSVKHGWRSRMRSSSFDPTVRTIWLVRGSCQKRRLCKPSTTCLNKTSTTALKASVWTSFKMSTLRYFDVFLWREAQPY